MKIEIMLLIDKLNPQLLRKLHESRKDQKNAVYFDDIYNALTSKQYVGQLTVWEVNCLSMCVDIDPKIMGGLNVLYLTFENE